MPAERIDSHHHLWQYNDRDYIWMSEKMSILRRDFLLPDLERNLAAAGIDGGIAVQARQMIEETEWLLDLSHSSPLIRGVVGWVPLVNPDLREILDRFAGNPKLKGVRHVVHDEPDDAYILRQDFNRGVSLLQEYDLAYDILIFERHLPRAIQFVDLHTKQVFIVDHIAKPRIGSRRISPWRESLCELARRENVYCKLSGMVTEADWKAWTQEDLAPYFDLVLAAFGPKRIMFGSDWPVVELAADYSKWTRTVQDLCKSLSCDEKARIWGATAIEAYRLQTKESQL